MAASAPSHSSQLVTITLDDMGEKEKQVDAKESLLDSLLDPKTWNLPVWDSNKESTPLQPNADTIERLDVSLKMLARYRNSLCPFNRLTSDILIMIFQEIENDHWDPFFWQFGSYSWMVVSKVCHTWRSVILDAPILWRQLSTRYPTAALTAMERSGEAGLCLSIPEISSGDKATAVIEAVAKQMHRLRWLYIPSDILKTSTGQIHQMIQPLTQLPAPMLEHLITTKVRGNGSAIELPVLFQGHTPLLHRLRTHYVWPQLSSVSLGKLKYLEFCGKKHTPIPLGISAFLDMLELAPRLEALDVTKVAWEPAPEDDTRKVHLEELKYLNLGRSPGSAMSKLLERLVIPECAMRLQVYFDRYDDTKFHIGIPSEGELEVTHHLHGIKKLHLDFLNGYDGVVIKGQTGTQPFEIHGMLESETITNLGDMDAIAGTVFQSIVRTLDLQSVEEFSMSEMRSNARWIGFTKKVWADMFKRMPNLHTFVIQTDPSYDEGFYRPVLSVLTPGDGKPLLCPSLVNLFVMGDKTWSSLQCFTVAQKRSLAGHPFKRVSMRLPHYSSFDDPEDTDLPLLRQYVETVDLNPEDLTFPEWPNTWT